MKKTLTLATANHNKDHSVMIFTSLDVYRGIFVRVIDSLKPNLNKKAMHKKANHNPLYTILTIKLLQYEFNGCGAWLFKIYEAVS